MYVCTYTHVHYSSIMQHLRTYIYIIRTYYVCVYYFSLKGEDKISHYSIIVLGVSTLGMSVLLWWLYRYFSSKNKDDVEGTYECITYVCYVYTCVHVWMCVCMHVGMYIHMHITVILCTLYTAHSAVPLSSTKSSKKYVLVHMTCIYMFVCMYMYVSLPA